MERKRPENYQIEDFVTDETFINYHFQLNDHDRLYWENWLKENPYNNMLVQNAKELLQTLSLKLPDDEYETELEKIQHAIDYKESLSNKKQVSVSRFLNWPQTARVIKNKKRRLYKFFIPVMLLILATGYFLFHQLNTAGFELKEKYNHSSAPIVFTLSDSTIVTLAPESILKYPGKFNENNRTVYLDGEAQFHVKRDIIHPFKVYTGKLVTTVLGTVFNIKQPKGDSIVQVELLKGKLKVESLDSAGISLQSIILIPDERVIYNTNAKKLFKETWQPDNRQNASPNHIAFQKDNFEAIAKEIKKVFSVIIINQSNKKDWLFTGVFNNTTAKDIVENICIIKKLNYQVQGDTIFIK